MERRGSLSLQDMRILIVGPSALFLAPFKLFEFLHDRGKVESVTFIGHPLIEQADRRSLFFSYSRPGQVKKVVIRRRTTGLLSFLADIPLTLHLLLQQRRRYDLYIATMPHLALLGTFLRAVGLVRTTVLWTFDYFPRRFSNPALNWLYLKLDETNAVQADYLWDVTPAMVEARRRRGVKLRQDRVLTVSHPIWPEEIAWAALEAVEPDTLIYTGLLHPEDGFELILEALPLVVERRPQATVTVTSYQPFPEELKERIRARGLQGSLNIVGFIEDEREFARLLQRHRVGLAPYRPGARSWKNFADATRAKIYMSKGLPVIITDVPPLAREIDREGAGLVIRYDKTELAEAIIRLLADEPFYRQCRENAIRLISKYQVDNIFRSAFQEMGIRA